jgi:hypothetical protein
MTEMTNGYTILVGNPGGKRSLKTPGCIRKDTIEMYLRYIGFEGVDWIHLA